MMQPEEQLDRNLEALRLERSPEDPLDEEGADLLALARAVRRLRPAEAVDVPPAQPLRSVLRSRRRSWLGMVGALAAAAAVILAILTLRPVDIVSAAEEKLSALTRYHYKVEYAAPATGGMEVWYDQGKYRIAQGDRILIYDGAGTEWHVFPSQRLAVKTSGLPGGAMPISTIDDLLKVFHEYPETIEGEEEYNGRQAYRLAIPMQLGNTRYIWLDKQTYLPLGGRNVDPQGKEYAWTEHWETEKPIDPALFNYEPPAGFKVDDLLKR